MPQVSTLYAGMLLKFNGILEIAVFVLGITIGKCINKYFSSKMSKISHRQSCLQSCRV